MSVEMKKIFENAVAALAGELSEKISPLKA